MDRSIATSGDAGGDGAAARRGVRPDNGRRLARVGCSVALGALTTLFTTVAHAQASAPPPTPAELEQQVAAVREQLRAMQDQQKVLTETLDRLQLQLGGQTVPAAAQPAPLPTPPRWDSPSATRTASSSGRPPTTPRCLSC
jgi:hypothetical protein